MLPNDSGSRSREEPVSRKRRRCEHANDTASSRPTHAYVRSLRETEYDSFLCRMPRQVPDVAAPSAAASGASMNGRGEPA